MGLVSFVYFFEFGEFLTFSYTEACWALFFFLYVGQWVLVLKYRSAFFLIPAKTTCPRVVPPTVAQALPNQTLNKKMLPQTCPQPTWSKHFLSVGSSSQLTLVGVKPMKPINTDYLSNVSELEIRKWRCLSGTHTVYTIWQLSAVPRIYTIRMKLKFFQHTPANISSTFCPPAFLNSLSVHRQSPVLRSGLTIPFQSTLFPTFLMLLPKCYSASAFKCTKSFKVSRKISYEM